MKLDHRHHTRQLLWEGNVKERYFPNWGMAYCQRSKTLPTDSGEKLFSKSIAFRRAYIHFYGFFGIVLGYSSKTFG
ncbi:MULTISPECIES: hypothetical protein [unclassified Maribacter]|uniref:hypothetical protein n=1 Tax=unclassified Maribacter TaxID=2615042 RepID=UPI0039C90A41